MSSRTSLGVLRLLTICWAVAKTRSSTPPATFVLVAAISRDFWWRVQRKRGWVSEAEGEGNGVWERRHFSAPDLALLIYAYPFGIRIRIIKRCGKEGENTLRSLGRDFGTLQLKIAFRNTVDCNGDEERKEGCD